jgi:solute carrier family 10 (sodium/bile acid cotransporter), member 7
LNFTLSTRNLIARLAQFVQRGKEGVVAHACLRHTAAYMLSRLIPDPFILILFGVILFATFLPARGQALDGVGMLSNAAIFALFFFHGLRLSHASVWAGMKEWRLQLTILGFGFVVMPLAGLMLATLMPTLLSQTLWTGILFLCALPSTVQSAIAYSSLAKGNVAAALIAAALSNLVGVVLTPLIMALMLHISGAEVGFGAVLKIAGLLLFPFLLGQAAQRWLGHWAQRHKAWIGRLDKVTIALAVYTAFSAAIIEGVWERLSGTDIGALLIVVTVLLGFACLATWALGRSLGMARADRITLLFSGSHKTLATGAPMARILFPGAEAGLIIIPLMIYHQMQLIISAWLAARLARAT